MKLGSGSSTALQMLPTRSGKDLNEADMTAIIAHLTDVELMDADLFATSMADLAVDAASATARAVSGTRRLGVVISALNPRP